MFWEKSGSWFNVTKAHSAVFDGDASGELRGVDTRGSHTVASTSPDEVAALRRMLEAPDSGWLSLASGTIFVRLGAIGEIYEEGPQLKAASNGKPIAGLSGEEDIAKLKAAVAKQR